MTMLDALWDVAASLPWWVWLVLAPVILGTIWGVIAGARGSLAESARRFNR